MLLAQQRVLAEIDPVALVDLASALIRIPSFKTEETPVARFCTWGAQDEPGLASLTVAPR